MLIPFLLAVAAAPAPAPAPAPAAAPASPADSLLRVAVQRRLDSLRVALGFPGATVGIALPDGRTLSFATGVSDTAARTPMRPTDRLLQGSVGKTYVAAVALQLVGEGKLDLDAKVVTYLGHLDWFARIPNARDVTVRQLMTHTSGLVRYEFNPVVAASLKSQPYRVWTPADRLKVLLDTPAPFAAGQGWEYSDTNYIVLGMIIERLTGQPYYAELERRLLKPLALRHTIPSDRPELPGVANGYAGPKNDLGGYDASLVKRGKSARLAVNPQFEWTGGGIASTTEDLARWGKLLYEGKAIDSALVRRMLDAAVPAKLGPDVKYGLGVIVRPTRIGESWGHSGFFPGYATDLHYWPRHRVAVAVQVNSTNPYPRGLAAFATTVARVVTGDTIDVAAGLARDTAAARLKGELTRLMTESAAAWNRADLPGHVAMYTDSATMMGARGPFGGRDMIRANLERSFWRDGTPVQQLSFDDLLVWPLGPDHALMTGAFRLSGGGRPDVTGRYTLVWVRTKDGWKVRHDHSG